MGPTHLICMNYCIIVNPVLWTRLASKPCANMFNLLVFIQLETDQQEHSESADLCQSSSLPPYCLDVRFGESAWCSRSPQKFNQLFFISLQRYPANFIKIHSMLLSNGLISDWTVSIVIQITTEIYSFLSCTTLDLSIKFHCNSLIPF